MKTEKIPSDKLFRDFEYNLNLNGLQLEGSDRMALKRGFKFLLEKYTSKTVSIAIENFFLEDYAKKVNFPFRLFLKQIIRYTKPPSIYQLSINELINKHYKNPESGFLYEEISYSETDRELEIIKRIEKGELGTIYDISLEDIEKLITKRVYNQGKDAVPSSWTDAYFNRVKIYNTPLLYKNELLLAKQKKKEKVLLDFQRKKTEDVLKYLTELCLLYKETPSKKLKYQYLDTKFKSCDEQLKEQIKNCRTANDFKQIIIKMREETKND